MSSGPKTQTVVNDPWKNMPKWLEDAYKKDTSERERMMKEAEKLGPREILDMNDTERQAYNKLQRQLGRRDQEGREARELAEGVDGDFAGNYEGLLDEYGLKDRSGDLGGFDGGYDPTDLYSGDRLTEMIGDKDFGLSYTDDVVDTTLAGMDRQTERERLARQSRQAATGGTSNTRSAVEDAVAGQLSGMNRAQMEAELRDSAERYGGEMLLKQAGLLDESDYRKAEMADDAARFLSEQNLTEQEMEEMSKRFGMEFDKGLADSTQGAFEGGANFEMDRAKMLDEMTDSAMRRNIGGYELRNAFGEKQRGIDQANADKERTQLEWLMGLRTGSNNKGATPTGDTQTTTTPGNSAMQNFLGIGSSLLGGWMALSDETKKHDIADPEGSALEKLAGLSAKEYQYDEGFGHTTDRTSGLMAQDIEKAGITGAVKEIDGVKHVDPYPVLATVVQAVNELSDKVEAA